MQPPLGSRPDIGWIAADWPPVADVEVALKDSSVILDSEKCFSNSQKLSVDHHGCVDMYSVSPPTRQRGYLGQIRLPLAIYFLLGPKHRPL
mmetsp:Transcript_30960/g.64633  ORF Transcript_30960/g.64633 Transcript_30960/m.64633 type:complete len:91 (-) Transcript_30960:2303-2575(-)